MMKKVLQRRGFLYRLATATFAGALFVSCRNGGGKRNGEELLPESDKLSGTGTSKDMVPQNGAYSRDQTDSSFEKELANNREMPRELVMQLLDQKVENYMQISYHCAQSSFLALQEQFGLGGDEIVKALTPVSGIAERGETCGAVTGPLMIFGLIYGRDRNRLNDWETYRASLLPSGTFCDLFEKEYGSTMCSAIQNREFGKCYRLTDPAELEDFQESGATEHCTKVVQQAVRIAAGLILDDRSLPR